MEEALCVVEIAVVSWGGNGNEKLSDEYDNTENEPDPGSYNAEDGSERDLIDGMAVISPSLRKRM